MEGKKLPEQWENGDYESEVSVYSPDQIKQTAERMSTSGYVRDKRMRAIYGAIGEALIYDERFKSAVEFMLDYHQESADDSQPELEITDEWEELSFDGVEELISRNYSSNAMHRAPGNPRPLPFEEYACNLIARGLTNAWLTSDIKNIIRYPEDEGFLDIRKCREAIGVVTSDTQLYEKFAFNIATRPVQSNFPDRYIGPKLAILKYLQRFDHPVTGLDVGHSLGLGTKKMLANRPFKPPIVKSWAGMTPYLRTDDTATRSLSERLSEPVEFGDWFGMDIYPGDRDPATEAWIRNSFHPAELMNQELMAEIDYLAGLNLTNFTSLQGNFAKAADARELKSTIENNQVDVVMFITIWHQLTIDDRAGMLVNAFNMLPPDGIIIAQDFVDIRNTVGRKWNVHDGLYFPHEWGPYSYRTLIFDKATDNLEPEIAFTFRDGRGREIILSDDYQSLAA